MGNSIEPNTKEYYQLQSEYWFNECCKCTNACNELINDMEEVKRKAEAFDEIEGLVSKTKSAEDLGECVLQLLIENKEANHEG